MPEYNALRRFPCPEFQGVSGMTNPEGFAQTLWKCGDKQPPKKLPAPLKPGSLIELHQNVALCTFGLCARRTCSPRPESSRFQPKNAHFPALGRSAAGHADKTRPIARKSRLARGTAGPSTAKRLPTARCLSTFGRVRAPPCNLSRQSGTGPGRTVRRRRTERAETAAQPYPGTQRGIALPCTVSGPLPCRWLTVYMFGIISCVNV